ncbi:hypothetical protein L6452_31580 [Arctium lappa]|uniref:Uncharacterized protein n=1 Tax=Arctium lappa TaxID=4217 RepID=A0ACB8Z2I4_ARCLA|nr:hypothetical protein L6452_31580 [Arctium lappa]
MWEATRPIRRTTATNLIISNHELKKRQEGRVKERDVITKKTETDSLLDFAGEFANLIPESFTSSPL